MIKIRYILLIFLIVGGVLIIRYNNYKINNPEDRISFVKDYGKWLFGVGKSVKNVVGAAVHQSWLPEKKEKNSNEDEINLTNKSRNITNP